MLGVIKEWNENWRQTFLEHTSRSDAWGGSVTYDRDAVYGSKQRKSATLLLFSRSRPANTAPILKGDE